MSSAKKQIRNALMALLLSNLIAPVCFGQVSCYGYAVTNAGNQQYTLGNYQGEKIMLVLLPSTQTASDSAFVARIDSVALANAGSLKIIAVPSYEDGYASDSIGTVQQWYMGLLDSSVLMSQALYTHKTSGSQQDSVFQWLTNASMNMHFDDDVPGAGSMYFIDEHGNLYGVFGPEAMFSDKALNKVL